MKKLMLIILILSVSLIYAQEKSSDMNAKENSPKTEEQWKQELTDEEYRVLRDCGTEPAFTGNTNYRHQDHGEQNQRRRKRSQPVWRLYGQRV